MPVPLPSPVLLLPKEPYATFADRLQETCLVGDPWYEGEPVFHGAPLVLQEAFVARLYDAGARIGALYDELTRIVHQDPDLLDTFFHLLPHYKLMWLCSDGLWHGFARMDMFELEDGSLRICEFNADTPTGQVEALVPGRLLRDQYPDLRDPNADYEARWWDMLLSYHRARTKDDSTPRSVGLVYPSDLSEDITLIRLYQQWLEKRGVHAPIGCPMNLTRRPDGGVFLLGEPVDMIVRHYKTDWWGERPNIWADEEPLDDPDPLEEELQIILQAERAGRLSVVNPFGSLIAQNKLSLAFFHEEKERFSAQSQASIDALIPLTRRLDTMDKTQLKTERALWVLKSDFGCEGDEVVIGPWVDDAAWATALDMALEETWVVQRYFDVKPMENLPLPGTWLPNYGVYLIAGAPSGLMVRVSALGAEQDSDARVLPPFIPRAEEVAEPSAD